MRGATPALRAIERAGIAHTVHEYTHDPSVHAYGREAADALAVDAARVFKTLIVSCDGRLAVAMVPVLATVDLKAVATVAGTKRAQLADARDAERVTGYVVGAISPLGQKRALPTFVDDSANAFATIFCSGGRRGLEIELAPGDLIALAGARFGAIATPA